MAFQQPPSISQHRLSPNENLSSNNPFRRAVSPVPPASPNLSPPILDERRISTNPFLDTYQPEAVTAFPPIKRQQSPSRPAEGLSADPDRRKTARPPNDFMAGLSLNDKSSSERPQTAGRAAPPFRSGTLPPPAPAHRTTHSQEEQRRPRVANRTEHNGAPALDIFANPTQPSEKRGPRPRRNSETSVLDVKDEDRRRRERRERREREAKEGRLRSGRPKKPNQRLDLIDKLDVTSIYGPSMFHHDGPFDACNPHRNRKGARAAPMQAFPAGSANNALGGSGPVNRDINYDQIHGRALDAYTDYNEGMRQAKQPYAVEHSRSGSNRNRAELIDGVDKNGVDRNGFNTMDKIEKVHGEESAGLGSTTFLEGAPVPRAVLIRRESENADNAAAGNGGGLQRKRSIAQRIRGISKTKPAGFGESGRVTSPEGKYPYDSPRSPMHVEGAQSAGGLGRVNEQNPFFADVALPGADKKNGTVEVQPVNGTEASGSDQARRPRTDSLPSNPRPRTASSPSRGIQKIRTRTSDEYGMPATTEVKAANGGNGLLGRVKSLRGKKTRPERPGIAL